jgi:hypothetical protein
MVPGHEIPERNLREDGHDGLPGHSSNAETERGSQNSEETAVQNPDAVVRST